MRTEGLGLGGGRKEEGKSAIPKLVSTKDE